jgi:hypothetical protein
MCPTSATADRQPEAPRAGEVSHHGASAAGQDAETGAPRPGHAEPPRIVPDLGVGLGLRVPHYAYIHEHQPAVDFFEIISENFMVLGGKALLNLERTLEHYPLIQHGVSLNIGGPDEPDAEYLKKLKRLVERVRPAWLSDHLCWTGTNANPIHDLLPLPYTREMIRTVVERAKRIQDFLGVRFALENTSSYMAYRMSQLPEWEFVSEIVEAADIGLMFDVNNVYVAAYNHGFDAYEFVRNVPHSRIVQIHLAGHTNLGRYLIDTHNGDIIDPVWDLYRATIELAGPVSTLIEWDDEIPEFPVLAALAAQTTQVRDEALARRALRKLDPSAPSFALGKHLLPTPTDSTPPTAHWRQGGPRQSAASEAGAEQAFELEES